MIELALLQKPAQALMRFMLAHAMQIQNRIDLVLPAADFAQQRPLDRRQGQ